MPASREQADAAIRLCREAAEKSLNSPHRHGNVVRLTETAGDDIFIAADLHGNRLNFDRLCELADLENNPRRPDIGMKLTFKESGFRYQESGLV